MRSVGYLLLPVCLIVVMSVSRPAFAQRAKPDVFAEVDGDPVYTVLPPDAIPAIHSPTFVSGKKARAQMSSTEQVIGVVIDGQARAYSTWQLDTHEIVNDEIGGAAFAATW